MSEEYEYHKHNCYCSWNEKGSDCPKCGGSGFYYVRGDKIKSEPEIEEVEIEEKESLNPLGKNWDEDKEWHNSYPTDYDY